MRTNNWEQKFNRILKKPEFDKFVRVALLFGGISAIVISCAKLNRTVIAPPMIPGASYVGTKACAECHEELVRDFKTASHARLQAKGNNAIAYGCESCHGPGSIHAKAGGGKDNIVNPKKSPQICFDCHLDKRGEFQLAFRHPVSEGKMTCSDCHDPHKGDILALGAAGQMAQNENCLKCHQNQRGPFVFEHEAIREGCTLCHNPHGSVNAKMLTERNASLCLKCHFRQPTGAGQVLIGGWDHTAALQMGTCWSAGCHEAVHGSHVSSSLRF
jgi:predicted CXXCH cytochrome family protein